MKKQFIHGTVLILLLIAVTAAVGIMIKNFIMVIFLSGLTAAMAMPLNNKFIKLTKGKKGLSSAATLATLFLCVMVPLSAILAMFIGQAVQISKKIQPKVENFIENRTTVDDVVANIPHGDLLITYQDQILEKGGEIISSISLFFVNRLSSFTLSTVQFLFLFFLYLYTLFFFIKDGKAILNKVLYYLPLPSNEEQRLLKRFTSVTKATLKGTLLIGMIQGGLAGISLGLAGIDSALFWSIIMMVLSIIPVVGTVLIWLPAVVILILSGSIIPGILVLLWCGLIVGNIDNLLRPKLVGQDAGLHELLILFSTLGGLSLFGMAGFIVGPILAAIWVTLWDIYGEMFSTYLPAVEPVKATGEDTKTVPGQDEEKQCSKIADNADAAISEDHSEEI